MSSGLTWIVGWLALGAAETLKAVEMARLRSWPRVRSSDALIKRLVRLVWTRLLAMWGRVG